jgi:DNA mismatch repair protein MSH3
VECFEETLTYSEAFDLVSEFYTQKTTSSKASESFVSGMSWLPPSADGLVHDASPAGELMEAVADLPRQVVIALAQCIKYLLGFGIADAFLATKFFTKFTTRSHMLLNGNTLTNLYAHSTHIRTFLCPDGPGQGDIPE